MQKLATGHGVTIEKKVGKIKGTSHEITDLPGIYSLSPYSTEEEISRKFVMEENPDLIINIVDATSLERGLYLTTQLMELDCKLIIALNMADILEKKGLKINIKQLEETLGVKVVQISALKEIGIEKLIEEIDKIDKFNRTSIFDSNIESKIIEINQKLDSKLKHKTFISVKLIEKDERFNDYLTDEMEQEIERLEKNYDTDMEETIATQRYDFIEKVKRETVRETIKIESISDKLDKIFLNKWIAFPIFIVIMFLVYYLSVGVVGTYAVDFMQNAFLGLEDLASKSLQAIGCSNWVVSLVVDGIIKGVGAVLGFVPQLIILFLCISLLETTGYMSRIALLLDRIFRKIGLSGKSLIPFIVGSGCSVPAIMGTRIIENEDERTMTTILTPFIPCSAKLPIIVLFTGYFFPNNSGLVSASLYFLAILVIILSAYIMQKFVYKNTSSTYISELPEYKIPSVKYVLRDVSDKVFAFIKRAGSIILVCSIVIWFLVSFSFKFEYGVDVQDSILASIGKKISWIFTPMLGTNSWEATVSAIQGLVAKEQVVSSMAVINGLEKGAEEGAKIFARSGAFGFFTSASAYAFMVFNLFSAPCFGAIGAMKRELGNIKKLLKAVTFQTVLAWILATIVYQIGSRIESKVFNFANVIIISIITVVVIMIILSKIKNKDEECAGCPYSYSCNKK